MSLIVNAGDWSVLITNSDKPNMVVSPTGEYYGAEECNLQVAGAEFDAGGKMNLQVSFEIPVAHKTKYPTA